MAPSPTPRNPDHVAGWVQIWAGALWPVLIAVSILAIMVVIGLGVELRSQLRSFQEEPIDNIHWNVTQLELDIVRFEAEAELMQLRADAPLKELRIRFDLFYSRAQSSLQGRMFAQLGMADIVAPMNERLQRFLDVTTPLIDGDDATLRRHLVDLQNDANALREDLRTMSVDLIDNYAALADRRRSDFAMLLQQVAWASAALLSVLVLLLMLVLQLNRRAERKASETRRVSSRLAATVDTSLDAIIVASMDGLVLDFNAAATTIFGFARDEAIGRPLSDLIIPPHHREAHDKGMERMQRTGEMRLVNSGRFRITAMRKDRTEFPVEMSLASTKDDGEVLFISYLRDISHRIASENAVIAARDKALAAEQAKTSFMAVMSHEMRTPLNGVMAALEIAARDASDPKQARFIQLARSSATQLLRHANEVLDIAKIDAGGLDLAEEDFDLADLVNTLVGALTHVAAQKGTEIEVQALSPLPMLYGDAFRLGQIIQNFLSNAIKFTDEGIITIEYEVVDSSAEGISIEVRVADSGIGISEADQARVFDDFVMIDPSYGRNFGGTGLGLAIARRLAGVMGGEVGVESALGEGSVFWLRIPFRLGQTATPVGTGTAQPPKTRPLDILVVEDNATNRIVIEEMLLHLGHKVTLAVDGGEGMTKAREHAFEVILMDISMPTMDGLTATEMIRWDGLSKSARIIAITAHSMPQDRERFTAAGMDGRLTKPISEAALAEAIAGQVSDAAAATLDDALLNHERVADLRAAMGGPGVQRMFGQFLRELPGLLTRLETSATLRQSDKLIAAAHEGAGACAMVGATALGRGFAAIEEACRAGDLAAAAALVPQVAAMWQATADSIAAAANAS